METGLMVVSDESVDHIVEELSDWGEVSVRSRCTSGFDRAGPYREGTMLAVVADDVAYLRVDDSNRDDFKEPMSRRDAEAQRTILRGRLPHG
jgi:TfoX/Sxy family transcriptional regulator of competence genes